MTELTRFAVLGLGTGAIYVLLAQGLVVMQRGSGVLNFALGAYATVGAYVFVELQNDRGMGGLPAMAFAVALVALLGAVSYLALVRPLHDAPAISKVVATLAILVVLRSLTIIRYGAAPIPVFRSMLPRDPTHVFGTVVGADRLWLVAIATLLTVALWALFRFTTVGLATTASAEKPETVAALGWSPNVMATASWALGAGLAASAGILVVPIFTAVDAYRLTLVLISALAVALIGQFRSFPLVLAGGIALGVAESVTSRYVDPDIQGASKALPLLVIVALLVVRGRSLPSRGDSAAHLPLLGAGRFRVVPVLVAATVVSASLLTWVPNEWLAAVLVSTTAAVILLSIVVLTGYCGQLSLGQFALAGIGALIAGRLVATTDVPFELAIAIAMIGAVPIGALFAIPALRTRGINLAVVTLGLGAAVQAVIFANTDYTGGFDGTPVGGQHIFGIDIDPVRHQDRYAVFTIVCLVVASASVASLRRSRSGRRLVAVRANERAAAAMGIDVLRTKIYAFSVSATIASLGGILLAFQSRTILYRSFDPFSSILAVTQAVIGGVGFILGPLFGAPLASGGIGTLVGDRVGEAANWQSTLVNQYLALVTGALLIVVLVRRPDGVASFGRRKNNAAQSPTRLVSSRTPTTVTPTRVSPRHLVVRDLEVRFGGLLAVTGLDLDVAPGQIVGLIGANGAGKTTAIDAITGFVRTSNGKITLDGISIDRTAAHRRARAGFGRSFQSLELFDDVSVRENLLAASDRPRPLSAITDLITPGAQTLTSTALDAVEEFGLTDLLDTVPGDLPHGQRRLVAIARAVASSPSILLLDEPAAGLDEVETQELAHLVRRLAATWGMGILLVEHDMTFVMQLCDEVVALDFGRVIFRGTPDEVRRNDDVRRAYLGEAEEPDLQGPEESELAEPPAHVSEASS